MLLKRYQGRNCQAYGLLFQQSAEHGNTDRVATVAVDKSKLLTASDPDQTEAAGSA